MDVRLSLGPRRDAPEPDELMAGTEADLVLAGHRVRVLASDPGLLRGVLSVLVPPCTERPVSEATAEWLVDVSVTEDGPGGLSESGRPALCWQDSGMRLTVLDRIGWVVTLAARYRADSATALLTVDWSEHRTSVLIPGADVVSRRWADWVVRAFFGPRLLADGWVLLHAAAVRATADGGDRALLVLAGPRGGKSTIAHRACVELGAGFMADDLVLIRPGADGCPLVIGWPTRICVPVELLDEAMLDALPEPSSALVEDSAQRRRRLVLSPPEYQRLLGVRRAEPGPVQLGGVLVVLPQARGLRGASARCLALAGNQLAAAIAEAGRVPAQRLRMLDLLGVAGDPAVTSAGIEKEGAAWLPGALAGIPAAGLELADISALPRLPVWDLAGSCFPWLPRAAA